jgi:hypothetical protein
MRTVRKASFQMINKAPKSSAVFLGALFSLSPVVHADSLDRHLLDFVNAVKAGDSAKAVDSLADAAIRLKELNGKVSTATKPAKDVADTLELASEMLAAEPQIFRQLVADIKQDTLAYESVKPGAPECVNPLKGVPEQVDERRAQFSAKRARAQSILEEAKLTERETRHVQEQLEELNASPAGTAFNLASREYVGGGKLLYILAEVGVDVRPALTERAGAAQKMVGRYDAVILRMEQTLERHAAFSAAANRFLWQDFARGYEVRDRSGEIEALISLADAMCNASSPNAPTGFRFVP